MSIFMRLNISVFFLKFIFEIFLIVLDISRIKRNSIAICFGLLHA